MAKSRVSPLRQTTIPRLELMAALVGIRLTKTICDALRHKPNKIFLWLDSKIILHWIHTDSASLGPFVGIRIGEIQSTYDKNHWRYIPTELNPADDLSRGIPVKKLSD